MDSSDSDSPETFVSKYLIDNTYYLTALEFYCETYERSGVAIDVLSQFFEDSANFLMFEEMKSVSEISSNISESSGLNYDAIRIKDDRIAVLEHDIRVLRDSLEEAQAKLRNQSMPTDLVNSTPVPSNPNLSNIASASSISTVTSTSSLIHNQNSVPVLINSPSESDEDTVICQLISKYLQTKNLKLSSLAFNNETGITKKAKNSPLAENFDLYQVLRSYRLFEQSPRMFDDMSKLRKESEESRNKIILLEKELNQLRSSTNQSTESTIQNPDEPIQKDNTESTNEIEATATDSTDISHLTSPITTNISFNSVQESPSVSLLNSVFSDMMQLMNVIDSNERRRILHPLETIVRYHPQKETRIQCISLIFNLWEEPNEEQRGRIIQTIKECCVNDEEEVNLIQSEVLPVVSQLLGSSNPSMLCLVASSVGSFAKYCAPQLRSSLLLSIVKQLSEHSVSIVRESAVKNGSLLIESFLDDPDSTDKLPDLLDLCKLFVFDPDASVQQSALQSFAPMIMAFTKVRRCVGREFCEFWMKIAFSFGLTGSSSLAALRFSLCCRVLESSLKFIVPVAPRPDQQLVAEASTLSTNTSGALNINIGSANISTDSLQLVQIPKTEYEWITQSLIPQLPKFAPTLFVPINIRKEADRFIAQCCKSLGTNFVAELIVPEFLTAIDKAEGDLKEKIVTLFLSAVAPMCDQETFFTHSRNFLTYATNELRGFKNRDVQEYFAPAFSLLTAREPEKRPLVFKQIDSLSKSSRVAIKTAAVSVLCEILPTLDENDIEKSVMPIVLTLAQFPDETLLQEVINCVGSVARFASSNNVMTTVKELFESWCKDKRIPIRMQALRVFTFILNDVDEQFRDGFVLPQLFETVNDIKTWNEPGQADQAIMLILHIIHSIENPSEKAKNNYIIPMIDIIKDYDMAAHDPKLEELMKRYHFNDRETAFSKKFGPK
ncbi:hypothetical protein M9Y10_006568 [Tritrichomonas musculus]|uniref:LisH domain-containing protein n=1 Tax=Tritrichomonas musculus TaxID=1915356 RepID=A0ABR2JF13_9EUKA